MSQQEGVRLSKRMAELGLCSRSQADDYIVQGMVEVDGVVVDVLGSRVLPQQSVTLRQAAPLAQPERISALLHKPAALDGAALAAQLTPARRAGDDASGLVYLRKHQRGLQLCGAQAPGEVGLTLLTQDGKLARQCADGDFEQEWLLDLAAPLPDGALARLRAGTTLDGKPLRPGRVSQQGERQLCLVLKRSAPGAVTALLAAAGVAAQAPRCIRIGRLRLGKLMVGQWRYLARHEKA